MSDASTDIEFNASAPDKENIISMVNKSISYQSDIDEIQRWNTYLKVTAQSQMVRL